MAVLYCGKSICVGIKKQLEMVMEVVEMAISKIMIKDALRYIGMPSHQTSSPMSQQIEDTYKELEQLNASKYIYNHFPITINEEVVSFEYTKLQVKSKDLAKLLANCNRCYVLAATMGQEADKQISRRQKTDMLEAVILDACASVLVDKICDDIEMEITEEISKNEFLTMRFSPGYGDVPLDVQQSILDILNATKQIGMSLTKTNMLLPTKSVTAFIGISHQKEERQKSCEVCSLVHSCIYRKRGDQCGL